MKKVTYFNCDEDLSVHDIADGPVTFCAISADGAIPDNPHGPNQGSTAENANRSGRVCDSIVVDRTPPQATVTADRTTVLTGDLVSFGVQASDATSGLAGDYAWKWGDDAADGTGAAPRRLKLTSRTRTLPIGLTTEGPGTVALALVRGKVHARGTLRIAAAGTLGYKLGLPRKLKAGAHQLKISFTPQGAGTATTKTVRLLVSTGRAKARRATLARAAGFGGKRAAAPREPRLAGAPFGVPTGKASAAPKSRRVRLPVD